MRHQRTNYTQIDVMTGNDSQMTIFYSNLYFYVFIFRYNKFFQAYTNILDQVLSNIFFVKTLLKTNSNL